MSDELTEQILRYWGLSVDDPRQPGALPVARKVIDDAARGDQVAQTEIRCAVRSDKEYPS